MSNTIKLKRNSVSGQVPTTLADGELAVNTADEKLFIKNASGTIVEIQGASSGSGSGGSLPTQTGNNGLFLMTNGVSSSWEVPTFFMDGGNSNSQETGSADLIFDLS
jgi:hypothetical protein